jgi:hypothetical protein
MGSGALSSAAATATAWTVRPGGAITATAGKTTLKDTATGSVETCDSARMSGTLKGGAGLQGTGIGSVATATFHCPSPIVPPVKLTARGLPWHLNMVSPSYDPAYVAYTTYPSDITTTALANPDGSVVLYVYNGAASTRGFQIIDTSTHTGCSVSMTPGELSTFVW